jgi:glutathione S-transferase
MIVDGNRRWAKERALEGSGHGHRAGARKIPEFLVWCDELGIGMVTLYLLSTDNLTGRPPEELRELCEIIAGLAEDLGHQRNWKIKHVGSSDGLDAVTRDAGGGVVVPPDEDGGGVVIPESLAICEWAAEQQPSLWPADATARALARAASAIMHSGFASLRNDAPMNIRRRSDASRMTADGLADAARVDALWREWLARSGGPFLFGKTPTLADAMYAPVCSRFVTYDVSLDGKAAEYRDRIMDWKPMRTWIGDAKAEPIEIEELDIEF